MAGFLAFGVALDVQQCYSSLMTNTENTITVTATYGGIDFTAPAVGLNVVDTVSHLAQRIPSYDPSFDELDAVIDAAEAGETAFTVGPVAYRIG